MHELSNSTRPVGWVPRSALKVRAEAAVREGKQRRSENDKRRMMPTAPWTGGETFHSREKHEGYREGWVYKLGNRGLGYYADGAPDREPLDLNKALWLTEGLAPVNLELDQLVPMREIVGNPLEATTLDDTAAAKPSKRRQTKKETRGAQGIADIDAFIDISTIKGNDVSHRCKG
jgi:hypothetical protein